jgi:hypothetical protein
MVGDAQAKRLIGKVATLPTGRVAQVEDFVDFLLEREQVCAFTAATESAFAAVWDNSEDAAYDVL